MAQRIIVALSLALILSPAEGGMIEAPLTHLWGNPIYHQTGNVQEWDKVELDSTTVMDDNLSTLLQLNGLEGVAEYGGGDTGAFALLEFHTPADALELHLVIHARGFTPAGSIHNSNQVMMSSDGSFSPNHTARTTDGSVPVVSGYFGPEGNTFNGVYRQSQTIDDIRLPGNRFQFLLWGPYIAGLHDHGPQGIELLDVQAWYVPVPEPGTISILAIGGLALVRRSGKGVVQMKKQ